MNYLLIALHYFSFNGSDYFSLDDIKCVVLLPKWQHSHIHAQLKFLQMMGSF